MPIRFDVPLVSRKAPNSHDTAFSDGWICHLGQDPSTHLWHVPIPARQALQLRITSIKQSEVRRNFRSVARGTYSNQELL